MEDNWRSSKKPIVIGNVAFDPCFSREKIERIRDVVSESFNYIKMLSKGDEELPRRVECMTMEESQEGEKKGAGHGLYISPGTIKINPHMSEGAILCNYIHENIHHVLPGASENLVDHLTDLVAFQMNLKR